MTCSTLGIDISKKTFDVALINNKMYCRQFKNNNAGFELLEEWLQKKNVSKLHACMEATGIYGDSLANFLHEKDEVVVSVVNPARIKGFAQSVLARTKTDSLDAKLIARFCEAMKPKSWHPAPQHIQQLQALVRRLDSLNSMQRQESNRLETSNDMLHEGIKECINFIENQIKNIKDRIKKHINYYPDLKSQSELLKTIPGIGEATIAQSLTFLSIPAQFKSAKEAVAFVGLNPKQRLSGTSVRGKTRLSKTGDAALRKAFYMPAIVAMRYNPCIKAFCERLKRAGKHKMVIIGAAMRKLIHIIYGVLKSGKPFDPTLGSA